MFKTVKGVIMVYLESFDFPSQNDEDGFILSYPHQLEMQCFSANNAYPFKIFPKKLLTHLQFEDLTFIYGGNGSGKSTALNIIAEALGIKRNTAFNNAPCMQSYVELCSFKLSDRIKSLPEKSTILASDGVFDFLLDVRSINDGIEKKREELFREYKKTRDTLYQENPLRSFDDLDELRRCNEAKRKTKSQYTAKRLPKDLPGKSNGESAFLYFTQKIEENALYLLDEPENSLSARLQLELAKFIEDSVRFYGCQFIISTHSPFLLSVKGARIYDFDAIPVRERKWFQLDNIKAYYELFRTHRSDFEAKT